MFDSRDVAAYIAQVCIKLGYDYNNTKIQKLLYACYGAILVLKNERICDEYPRAWQYGPVFPKVFRLISKNQDLARYSCTFQDEAADEVKEIIKKVISIYGKHNATTLSRWSHKKGSPWDTVVNHIGKMLDFIPDDLIAAYFKENIIEQADYA